MKKCEHLNSEEVKKAIVEMSERKVTNCQKATTKSFICLKNAEGGSLSLAAGLRVSGFYCSERTPKLSGVTNVE